MINITFYQTTFLLEFGLIGAATMWIMLRWLKRPVNIMDLARGAASWVFALMVCQFISSIMVNVIGIEWVAVSMGGFLTGLVVTIAYGASLRLAGVALSKTLMVVSGATWGIGFALFLFIQFVFVFFKR